MDTKRRNKYIKAFLGLCLLVYALAVFHIYKYPCAIYSIQNCSLNGVYGLSYITVWSFMMIGGLYSIYLAIASLKHGVYSSEKILLMHKTKAVTGRKMYVYCCIFIIGGVSPFLITFVWWGSLTDTVSEYNYLYPDKYIDLRLRLEDPQQDKSEN